MRHITSREKRLDIAMLLGAAIAIFFAVFTDFTEQCEQMYSSVFRFHIMANSDSYEDQQVKVQLRDYILDEYGSIFTACGSKAAAKNAALRSLPLIERSADEFLQSKGCGYSAKCYVTNMEFPTRMYGDYTLPAGSYDALRIVLGEGEGHNWWCVLYPSVCLDAASVSNSSSSAILRRECYEREKLSNKRTADSLTAEREGVEFRFALYEALRRLFKAVSH